MPSSPILTQASRTLNTTTPPQAQAGRKKEVAFKKPTPSKTSELPPPISRRISSAAPPPPSMKKPDSKINEEVPEEGEMEEDSNLKIVEDGAPMEEDNDEDGDGDNEEGGDRDSEEDGDGDDEEDGDGDDQDGDGDDQEDGDDEDDQRHDPNWSKEEEYETEAETKRRWKNVRTKAMEEETFILDFMKELETKASTERNNQKAQMLKSRLEVLQAITQMTDEDRDAVDVGEFLCYSFMKYKVFQNVPSVSFQISYDSLLIILSNFQSTLKNSHEV